MIKTFYSLTAFIECCWSMSQTVERVSPAVVGSEHCAAAVTQQDEDIHCQRSSKNSTCAMYHEAIEVSLSTSILRNTVCSDIDIEKPKVYQSVFQIGASETIKLDCLNRIFPQSNRKKYIVCIGPTLHFQSSSG